tara:strand:+ start:295 stop:630 length:336 start_codon:yes stop_codon:yes gene_type:complete
MAFDHRNFATEGLFPGLVTTRSIANLGSFEIEVTITPAGPAGGGGGYWEDVPQNKRDYRINIRVTRKGKVWDYERVVNNWSAKVLAKLLKVKLPDDPKIIVHNVTVKKDDK